MTSRDIYPKIQETLIDALGVDNDDITPEATLVGDLGAESIDFLDIVFRLERVFDIKIPKGELFPEQLTVSNPEFVEAGKLTDQGVAALCKKLPHADFGEFANNPRVSNIQDLFTVQFLVNFIEAKLLTAV